MADDFNFAQLGQLRRHFACGGTKQRFGINWRHVERRQFVAALAGRRLFEQERLVL